MKKILEVNVMGTPTKIFIENNADICDENVITRPIIYTDNEKLSWLENNKIVGRISHAETEIVISFFEDI